MKINCEESEPNPLRAVHEAFDSQLEVLHELVTKAQSRGANARDSEIAIAWLLWMLGFSPTHIGGSPKTSNAPDLIATSPQGHFLVIECTTGILKEDNKLPHLVERAERPGLLWDFADPLLELSVGRPYALRNQFVFAVVHLAHQANSRMQKQWRDDLPADRKIDYKLLAKVGAGWQSFPQFLRSLDKLNEVPFVKSTKNFRHMAQHRFRLQFGSGLTPHVDRQETPNGIKYSYGAFRPLQLNNLIAKLYRQHQNAAKTFIAYWALLKELQDAWPTFQRDSATNDAEINAHI